MNVVMGMFQNGGLDGVLLGLGGGGGGGDWEFWQDYWVKNKIKICKLLLILYLVLIKC